MLRDLALIASRTALALLLVVTQPVWWTVLELLGREEPFEALRDWLDRSDAEVEAAATRLRARRQG